MTAPRQPPGKRDNPLRVSKAFRAFVLDQLEALGGLEPRAMFGGVGLYCRGVFFGIIAGDVLYLKVDDATRGDYQRAGSEAFCPYPERGGTMRYYAVPVNVLESADEVVRWAKRAAQVAEREAGPGRRSPRDRAARRTRR